MSSDAPKFDPNNFHIATVDGVEIRIINGALGLSLNGSVAVRPIREVHAMLCAVFAQEKISQQQPSAAGV